MNHERATSVQQCTGQVLSMFYLVDEPVTTVTIQVDIQLMTARATGQVALDLRTLPRGATICATLHDEQLGYVQLLAFTRIPC